MANERYNFKYLPLVGKLPGKSMVEQTETAINELASVVYDNVGHVGNLAEEVQTANTNASNALDKATEALETSGRVYIKQIAAVDVNDYYDSELYYIDNDGSTNIPVRDTGFLEVKTNDDKTACEQVFIADSTGTPYYRHGRITEQTLGEETTYVVTWSSWYREPQADWNVTDTTSKAYIKNKPEVYPNAEKIATNGDERDLINAKVADSDKFRLRVGGSSNNGWVELATGDDASEPIYVRQYSWKDNQIDPYFGLLKREAALLDSSGNTHFPGTVTAKRFEGTSKESDLANGVPVYDTNPVGTRVGQIYYNSQDGELYTCTNVHNNTWEPVMGLGYYIDTKYGLTNDNFTEKFSDFLAKAVENDKIAVLTQTYTVNDAITIRADKVMLDSINGKLIGSGSIDFRAVKELYCRNIKYSITMKFNYRGDEEYKQKYRKIWIENCDAFGGRVQENFGLYISTPEPANGYSDRNQRDYTKYGIFLDNYSGYNALMIVNKSIDDTGATINGGVDNSALGITDRVTGVTSPAVLIDTTRNPFRVISPDAPPNDTIHHVAFDMGNTGNISIGCSTLNADSSFNGVYNIKIFSDYPTIAMKNGNYNVKALMYVDKYLGFSLNGATVLKISGANVTSIRNGNDIQLRLEGRNGNAVGLLVDDDGNLRISKYYTTTQDKDQPRLLYAGAVSSRPTLTHYAGDVGYMVFDKNLGKPIWWTGKNWVDATGTAV